MLPPPTATADPTAVPTPDPTPTTDPLAGVPTVGPIAGDPTATPVVTPLLPSATPSEGPSDPPQVAIVTGTDPGGGSSGGTAGGSNGPAGPGTTGHGGQPAAWGPVAAVMAMTGLHGPTFPPMGLAPTLVTTTGAVTAAMALGLFGRKRRDDDPPDEGVLATAVAAGVGAIPPGVAFPASGIGVIDRPEPGEEVGDVADMELLLPRWRRPSLLLARKADPIRDSTPAARLTFDAGLVGPLAGRERRVIRYRVVRLLDSPDELRGAEIGYLDQGDEVQLIEKYGAYWLVLSPDGQQGWLHKMTLSDTAQEEEPAPDMPVATMPATPETWTMGESDLDSDVFEAYLESRRRRG